MDVFVAEHRAQLVAGGVPESLWSQIFDQLVVAMKSGRLEKASNELLLSPFPEDEKPDMSSDESADDAHFSRLFTIAKHALPAHSTAILVDHMVSFRTAGEALSILQEHEALTERIARLVQNWGNDASSDLLPQLLESLVPLIGTYQMRTSSSTNPSETHVMNVFYLMDEVGSLLNDTSTSEMDGGKKPNVRVAPFFHLREGVGYSVVWPVEDITAGESLRYFKGDAPLAGLLADIHNLAQPHAVSLTKLIDEPRANDTEPEVATLRELRDTVTVGCMCITPRPGMTPLMMDGEKAATDKMGKAGCMSNVDCNMIQLSLGEDFPEGCRQDATLAKEAAASLARRCDFVLAFACGDLVESIPINEEGNGGGDGGSSDANYGGHKLSRIRDILSVLEKLQNETNCVLYPTYEFHRFCFHKVEYMKQLVKCGVPILPTLFVSKEDWIASSSSNGYDHVAQFASQLADEYLRRQQCHWLLPPHLQLNERTLFIKLDGLWCREGVLTTDLALGCDDDPHPPVPSYSP